MSRRKGKYVRKPFESIPSQRNDAYASIYMSMLTHIAYTSLTPKQQQLYVYCKAQYYWENKSKLPEEYRKDGYFTMNRSKYAKLYGLYSLNDTGSFIRDMTALIEHGLIDCVLQGESARVKNIYKFSSRWHDYGEPKYSVPCSVMTNSMLRKMRKSEQKN